MATIRQCATCGAALTEGIPDGQCPECLIQLGLKAGAASANDPSDGGFGLLPREFGDYTLLEEIDRGGMGVVYRARQKSLDRFVAVKLILSGHFAGKDSIHRFRTEASAAAALQHPNIVAIHEVGVHQGEHYLAMDLVEGPNLAQFVKNTTLPSSLAARWLKTIAEAIYYAHERGILHRDLKPSNVLIDVHGEPRVTDFGLAKRLERGCPQPQQIRHFNANETAGAAPPSESAAAGDSRAPAESLTLTGQVLGSPNYIPPEQASGKRGQVSRRSDVYSLGAILYHLLTGRGPFLSDTVADTLQQVLHEEPTAPRLLNPRVPRDLETICLKCLQKEPARRYATAQELADELGRFLKEEPVLARPVSRVEKVWRWCRRKPVVAGLSAVSSLLLLTVVIGSPIAAFHINQQRLRADDEAHRARQAQAHAEAQEMKARLESYASTMLLAHESLELNDRGQVHELLEKTRGFVPGASGTNGSASRAPWEWRHLKYETRDESTFILQPLENTVRGMDVSSDNQWLGTGSSAGRIRLWDLSTRTVQFECLVSNEVACVRFSPDGGRMAAGCRDGRVFVLAVPSGTLLHIFSERERLLDLRFSADGQRLAYVSSRGWSIANLKDNTVHQWPKSEESWAAAISDDLRTFVQTLAPQGMIFHQSGTNALYRDVLNIQHHGPGATISPNGQWLALAMADRSIEIWSLREHRPLRRLIGHSNAVLTVAWSADSQFLASGGHDQQVVVWNTEKGTPLRSMQGHQAPIRTIVFSHDGSTLFTSAGDRTVRIWSDWQSAPPARSLVLPRPTEAWLAPGARFGCGQHSSGRLWFQTYPLLSFLEFPLDSEITWTWACSGDGNRLIGISGNDRRGVILERSSNGFMARSVELSSDRIGGLPVFSPNGHRLAIVNLDRTLGVWQVEPWRELRQWPGETMRAHEVTFDPPGKRLFIMRSDRPPVIADVSSGQLYEFPPEYERIIVSHDNRLAATTGGRGETGGAIWAAAPGEEPRRLFTFPGSNFGIRSISFSPDSSRLAIGLGNGQIKLWDFRNQVTVGVLRGHAQAVMELGFNNEDESLVSLSAEQVRVWRVVK